MRAESRRVELAERRAARKKDEETQKRIRHMDMMSVAKSKGGYAQMADDANGDGGIAVGASSWDAGEEADDEGDNPSAMLLHDAVFGCASSDDVLALGRHSMPGASPSPPPQEPHGVELQHV